MSNLDKILADLKILAPVMTNEEIETVRDAVVEARYHAKGQAACMSRILAVVDSVQERRK